VWSLAVSANGKRVVFSVAAGTNLYLCDLLADVGATNTPVATNATAPSLNAEGRTVLFQSFASDLTPGDFNHNRDIFVLRLGTTDSDNDGMPDDWEVTCFGNLTRDTESGRVAGARGAARVSSA
jgi:hypothetical protein